MKAIDRGRFLRNYHIAPPSSLDPKPTAVRILAALGWAVGVPVPAADTHNAVALAVQSEGSLFAMLSGEAG